MLTRQIIAEIERTENRHHERMRFTSSIRHQSAQALKEFHEAISAWHDQRYPTDELWSDPYLENLRASGRNAIEAAIVYLEVDPWYFRSGYLKERLIRGLKAASLTARDRRRLWDVVWNVAAGRNRREFRNYCSLATVVCDADRMKLLEEVDPERDHAAKGKFRYLLNHLRRHAVSFPK